MNGLEMLLVAGRSLAHPFRTPDFSIQKSNSLIQEAEEIIKMGWSQYHREELHSIDYQVEQVPPSDRIDTKKISGKGFFGRVDYVSPTLSGYPAFIKVHIPLNPTVDGLESIDTPELRAIRDGLLSNGYKKL